MRERSRAYALTTATAILLGLLGLPVAIGQVSTVGTAAPPTSQTLPRARGNTSGYASTGRRGAFVGQTYAMDRQSPLSTALVVLAEEASQVNLGTLTEDLNIMCRLFDRTLARGGLRSDHGDVFTSFLISHDGRVWGDRLFGNSSSWTECLYVEGYGPLFMIGVDFPLVDAPRTRTQPEPNEPSDPVWTEVSQELYAPPGNRRPERAAAGPAYNPEKVLSLKTAINRALKHAANIRGLAPEASVTVLVRGPHTMDSHTSMPGSDLEHSTRTSLLVIRASMKDIKEFAAGTLGVTEFEKRIQSVQY